MSVNPSRFKANRYLKPMNERTFNVKVWVFTFERLSDSTPENLFLCCPGNTLFGQFNSLLSRFAS